MSVRQTAVLHRGSAILARTAFWGSLILLVACVRLVSDYDPGIIEGASEVEREVDTILQNERSPVAPADASYQANKAAYNKINVDLNSLLTRAMAEKPNQEMVDQIKALRETINKLEDLHRTEGRLSPKFADHEQNDIQVIVSSIIRTENAKRAASSSSI